MANAKHNLNGNGSCCNAQGMFASSTDCFSAR
jgi:hypothetical protein